MTSRHSAVDVAGSQPSPNLQLSKTIALSVEEIREKGFSVIGSGLGDLELSRLRSRLDLVYEQQERSFGADRLEPIGELHTARCLLAADDDFLQLVQHPAVLEIAAALLGDYFILHLQNGILNQAGERHHQQHWHRDLPHQRFTSSAPLAISALWCLDAFRRDNGGTLVLPRSHRLESLPGEDYAEANAVQVIAKPGSILVFDSMVYHCSGANSSRSVRRAVNHVYTVPILKQQVDLPRALDGRHQGDPVLDRLLGYDSRVPASEYHYRDQRWQRNNRR